MRPDKSGCNKQSVVYSGSFCEIKRETGLEKVAVLNIVALSRVYWPWPWPLTLITGTSGLPCIIFYLLWREPTFFVSPRLPRSSNRPRCQFLRPNRWPMRMKMNSKKKMRPKKNQKSSSKNGWKTRKKYFFSFTCGTYNYKVSITKWKHLCNCNKGVRHLNFSQLLVD